MSTIQLSKADMFVRYSKPASDLFGKIIKKVEELGFNQYQKNSRNQEFIPGSFLILDSDKDWYISDTTEENLKKDDYNEISYTIFLFEDDVKTKPTKAPAMKFITSIKSNI